MRFVACTLAGTETGEGRTLILNLSMVVSMIRKGDVTHIDTGDEGVWRVKESPADLFRQEDAMVLCVSNQGTEFQQVIKEARARIEKQLAEENRVGMIRLERERVAWDRREREKLENAHDKLLAEKLAGFAKDKFKGHMGDALLALAKMGGLTDDGFGNFAADLALDVAEAVAKLHGYINPGRMVSHLVKQREIRKSPKKRK